MKKLIAVDLDETLLRRDKTYDRERFLQINERLNDRGDMLCVATGNSYHKLSDYFNLHDIHDLYLACDNGTILLKGDEVIYQHGLDYPLVRQLVEDLSQNPKLHPVLSNGFHSYFTYTTQDALDYIKRYNNDLTVLERHHEIPDKNFLNVSIYSELSFEENKGLIQRIMDQYPNVSAVTSGDAWMDIYVADGGKGTAIRYLQDKYQIKKENTIAFGDSLNDMSMMQAVGYSIAMENADPELKRHCRYQVGSNQEQSVLSTIERYLSEGDLDFMQEYELNPEVTHG